MTSEDSAALTTALPVDTRSAFGAWLWGTTKKTQEHFSLTNEAKLLPLLAQLPPPNIRHKSLAPLDTAGLRSFELQPVAAAPAAAEPEETEVAQQTDICQRRIVLSTIDARLIQLDAETGELCPQFGQNGTVDLKVGMGARLHADLEVGERLGRVLAPAMDVVLAAVRDGVARAPQEAEAAPVGVEVLERVDDADGGRAARRQRRPAGEHAQPWQVGVPLHVCCPCARRAVS